MQGQRCLHDLTGPAAGQASKPRAVFARHAASLIVLRQGPGGPEVLMGIRGAGHRFLPGQLVFPGGSVDPSDAQAPAAVEPEPTLLAMLGRRARPRLARALAMAAARELQEETGLSLGTPPRLDALAYLCRAVTPPSSPIRFNARFLIVPEAATVGVARDSEELHQVGFRPIDAVIDAGLMLVTQAVLHRLLLWLGWSHEARAARATLDVFQNRGWRTE